MSLQLCMTSHYPEGTSFFFEETPIELTCSHCRRFTFALWFAARSENHSLILPIPSPSQLSRPQWWEDSETLPSAVGIYTQPASPHW